MSLGIALSSPAQILFGGIGHEYVCVDLLMMLWQANDKLLLNVCITRQCQFDCNVCLQNLCAGLERLSWQSCYQGMTGLQLTEGQVGAAKTWKEAEITATLDGHLWTLFESSGLFVLAIACAVWLVPKMCMVSPAQKVCKEHFTY